MCIGERFITEGIACSFSEEIVPNKQKSYYTIVLNTTVDSSSITVISSF